MVLERHIRVFRHEKATTNIYNKLQSPFVKAPGLTGGACRPPPAPSPPRRTPWSIENLRRMMWRRPLAAGHGPWLNFGGIGFDNRVMLLQKWLRYKVLRPPCERSACRPSGGESNRAAGFVIFVVRGNPLAKKCYNKNGQSFSRYRVLQLL